MKVATERTIERLETVHDDPWVIASRVNVHLNNGTTIENYLLVEMKGRGCVLASARTKDGRFLFAHQCKPVAGMSVESVAGGLETASGDSSPDAERENQIREEMIAEIGYKPGRLLALNRHGFFTQTDRIDNRCHIFLAFDCEPTPEKREQDEKQGVQPILLTPEEVWQKIASGEIKDSQTLAGIFAHFLYESGALKLP